MKYPTRTSWHYIIPATIAIILTGCTKPKQTTAVSAAAGGAIGAGLGAIVGNQTGNAGSGLAIGAVAGAATGALIGNALQAQQEKLDSQRESIQRQDQNIRAQRSEIEELRRMQSDTGYSNSRTHSVNAYLVEQKRLQLQRRGPSPKGEHLSRYSPPPLASHSSEPLARYDSHASTRTATTRAVPVAVAPVADRAPAPASARVSKGLEERDLASAAAIKAEPEQEVPQASPAKVQPIKETLAKPVQEKSLTTSEAKVSTKGTQQDPCPGGKEAREAAANASENSDKLFHLRKALRICPNSAETHYELGQAYLNMDRAADASYEFKQALSLNPNLSAAQESLKELDQGKAHY